MVTGTPTVEARASTPRPESPARGRRIVIVLLAVVLMGGAAWWVFDRQTSIDVVLTGSSSAFGIAIEADYQPVLPTTVTGATVSTEVGSDDDASLLSYSDLHGLMSAQRATRVEPRAKQGGLPEVAHHW